MHVGRLRYLIVLTPEGSVRPRAGGWRGQAYNGVVPKRQFPTDTLLAPRRREFGALKPWTANCLRPEVGTSTPDLSCPAPSRPEKAGLGRSPYNHSRFD
jgi:hypothetical protein